MKARYNLECDCYIDTMHNEYRDTYSAWPFRIYAIKNSKILYKSNMVNSEYNIDELFKILDDLNDLSINKP
jgi:hypothetical protein